MQKTKNKTRKRLCAFCGRRDHKNKKCPPPCGVYYCDSVCQQHHWSVHRLTCAYRCHKRRAKHIVLEAALRAEEAALRDGLARNAAAIEAADNARSEHGHGASAGESKTGNDSAIEGADLPTLFFASKNGHTDIVKLLLQLGRVDVNQAKNTGATPLFVASQEGHTEVVRLLILAEGIDVNKATNTGATPLIVASENNHAEVVRLLLQAQDARGIDVNRASKKGFTPLYFASQNGHTEVVRLLLQALGIKVNQAKNDGATPLFIASQKGHTEVVKLLLQAEGIDTDKKLKQYTPLSVAEIQGHTEVVKLLNARSEHGHVADAGESKTVELPPMSAQKAKFIEEALAKMANGETSLELGRHQIGDVGAIAIADALPQSKLTSIYVHDNEIGDVGASKIAEALPQSELILLYLRGNQIGDVGASKIAEALPQSKLAELFLVDNQIGDAVKQRLEQCKNAEGKSIRMYL